MRCARFSEYIVERLDVRAGDECAGDNDLRGIESAQKLWIINSHSTRQLPAVDRFLRLVQVPADDINHAHMRSHLDAYPGKTASGARVARCAKAEQWIERRGGIWPRTDNEYAKTEVRVLRRGVEPAKHPVNSCRPI